MHNVVINDTIPLSYLNRLRELHTLKGKVESFAKLRGLDLDVNAHYTL